MDDASLLKAVVGTVLGAPVAVEDELAGYTATRTDADIPHLEKLIGRVVARYYGGYGTFHGVVRARVLTRPVLAVEYEDGDSEELYLDQAVAALLPKGTPPPHPYTKDMASKYGYTWPPPTMTTRYIVETPRRRQPPSAAMDRLMEEQRLLWQQLQKKQEKKQEKLAQQKPLLAAQKPEAKAKRKAPAAATAADDERPAEPAAKKPARQPAKTAAAAAAAAVDSADNSPAAVKSAMAKKPSTSAAVAAPAVAAAPPLAALPAPTPPSPKSAVSLPPKKRATAASAWALCAKCHRKHWTNTASCPPPTDELTGLATGGAPSMTAAQAALPSAVSAAVVTPGVATVAAEAKRWSGNTTAGLLLSLKALKGSAEAPTAAAASFAADADAEDAFSAGPASLPPSPVALSSPCAGAGPPAEAAAASPAAAGLDTATAQSNATIFGRLAEKRVCTCTVRDDDETLARECYKVVNSKLDVTCGVDGYGMTGNTTQGSMGKLLGALREKCEFDTTALFFDLGHGMGRPSMHAAALHPHIAASFGTEFNPQLYKQSMHVLLDTAQKIPCLCDDPRVFFMDANIKDMVNFNPFTHIYAFNIGMPEDVIDHMFDAIVKSATVKYAIMYPHRTASLKRLQALGEIVHSQSMLMPGGRSYEIVVAKVHHDPATSVPAAVMDADVRNSLEVLCDRALYGEYLSQLGIVSDLDNEQQQIRTSRGGRRHVGNTAFLAQSPCLPDISQGLLRRVALTLGVSTAGNKVKILHNIQEYTPVTFSLSLFAIGDKYSDLTVQSIVDRLLAVPPSRRQPEATHT